MNESVEIFLNMAPDYHYREHKHGLCIWMRLLSRIKKIKLGEKMSLCTQSMVTFEGMIHRSGRARRREREMACAQAERHAPEKQSRSDAENNDGVAVVPLR